MAKPNDIAEALAHNVADVLENGPRLAWDRKTAAIAIDRRNRRVLKTGFGAVGVGTMWVQYDDEPAEWAGLPERDSAHEFGAGRPQGGIIPMPPKEWLDKHTGVGSKGSAGAGWQEGWKAGRAARVEGEHGDLLTADEHDALKLTGALWNLVGRIVGDGRSRPGDLAEISIHIHNLQHAILAQAAARAYPDRYRLLGGTIIITEADHAQG